ncbi:peptidoglycan D,D-transpeptidase FtsI family protein [Pseudactinotalea sp.]|uniref:peptidoglycan D,D-transpeptidase FtsI family protein n=1 Tax=Pseudactinotalea sp. TaxID=1926260 RepID=UPI003B3AB9F9
MAARGARSTQRSTQRTTAKRARHDKRQNLILGIVLIVSALFAGRLVYVQTIAGPALAQAAADSRSFSSMIVAPRGDIVDSEGHVLATSVSTYKLILDLDKVPEYELKDDDGEVIGRGASALAQQLAPILGLDANVLGARLVGNPEESRGRQYFVLARRVSADVRQQVAALKIPGFSDEVSSTRNYPNGTVAGPLLGWVNDEGDGVTGIESVYSGLLTGTNGEQTYELGAAGQLIPTGSRTETPAVPGCDIHLTIDLDIQYTAEQVITDTVNKYGASWGAVVVMDTRTGRLLALADSNPYDPGKPPTDRLGKKNEMLSPALQASYEPGSTGKVLTVLTALEEGVVTPTTPIEDPYRLTVDGQTFTDHSEHPDQILTTTGVLAESANTGTVNIGNLMTDETRYSYMERMGWTSTPGLNMGESGGQLRPPDQWDGRTRFTTMFGQGVAVSLLQNTGVFNTIGNQGMHVDPVLVDGWTCDGEYTANEASEPDQVVSPESSDMMIRMLESVTHDGGTGVLAAVEGYRVAGKTGTAQTADGAGGITATTASFVGLVPADDPQLTIGVVVYKPTSGFFGGTVAAPVFQDVAAFTLPYLGIAPSGEEADTYPRTPDEDAG